MKRLAHYTMLSVWLLLCLLTLTAQSQGAQQHSVDDHLVMMMRVTGATVWKWSVNGWTELPQPAVTVDELAQQSVHCLRGIGMGADHPVVVTTVSPKLCLARAEYVTDNAHWVAVAQQMSVDGQTWRRYLSLRLECRQDIGTMRTSATAVEQQLCAQGGHPVISTCISGWLNDKLKKDFLEKTAKLALLRAGVQPRGLVSDGCLVSASGYVPDVHRRVLIHNEPVNIHLALRVNEREQRTYVTVGSPFIYDEY